MRPYDIFNKICPGGMRADNTGTLPSGRIVWCMPGKDAFTVGATMYRFFYLFAGKGCIGYPEDKEVLLKHWQPKKC